LGFVACQTNSPPLVFQDVSVSITPISTLPSNEGIDSYSFTPNVIDFNPSDSYICQQCISTPLFQVSDTTVCVGDTVNFFNTTIIGLTCFQQWYIDGEWYDGTINPWYYFDTAGDYLIQLMSTCGVNADTFNIVIHVYPIPIVSNQVLTVCSDIACGLTLGNDINGPSVSTYNIISINPNGLSSSAGTPIIANGVINSNLIDDAWTNTTNAPVNVIYTIVPVSALGCEGSPFTVTLTINPEPVFNVYDAVVCADHYVTLTGNPSSYSYSWDHGVSNNVPFIPPYTDTYNVVATDTITGCIQYSSALVTVHPNPIAAFIDICGSIPATLTNTSTGAVNYYWDMGDGSTIITSKDISYSYTIMDSMFYNIILIAESAFGCLDTTAKIFTPPLLFYVPNTYTPDGDEYNNTFIPVFSNKNKVESIHLLIYNRWGEIVFESKNIDFGWDGTYKNRKAQDGTYTWELIFKNNSCRGKIEHIYGSVNLLR